MDPTRRQFCTLLPALGAAGLAAAAALQLPVYAYHLKPPFMLDKEGRRGLYPALLAMLQAELPGWRFELSYLPRRRLDALMARGQLDGLVMAVSPEWFSPLERERNHWTPPLLEDADVLVSRSERIVHFSGAESLQGLRVALPRGYLIAGVNEAIAAGRILGSEPESETNALAMLIRGHVDAAVVTALTLRAWRVQNPDWAHRLHQDEPALGRYELGLLVPPALTPHFDALARAVRHLRGTPAWTELMRRELGSAAT